MIALTSDGITCDIVFYPAAGPGKDAAAVGRISGESEETRGGRKGERTK